MSTLWVLSGCTSISSQLVHRDDSNLEWEKKRYKGVPITLKVPTHLKIAVTETHFLGRPDGTNLGVVEIPVPIRSVHYDLLYTERVFTVDFKRPGAGTMNLTADFEDQYFSKIQHEVIDETIQDIATLVGAIAPSGLIGAPTATEAQLEQLEMIQMDSVVAAAMFEIDDPLFEAQVQEFLDCHLNHCHTCRVVAPWVQDPRHAVPQAPVFEGAELLPAERSVSDFLDAPPGR